MYKQGCAEDFFTWGDREFTKGRKNLHDGPSGELREEVNKQLAIKKIIFL